MKFFLKLLLISILFFSFVKPSFAQISGEHIESFNSNISINKDGSIDIKEIILYDFSDLERHGIFRTIPYTKRGGNGKIYMLSFSNFSVTDENNSPYHFVKTISSSSISLKIGDPNKTITGTHTYIISYKVSGALGYFSDYDEIYWNTTGNDWNVPIIKAKASVTLPEDIGKQDIKSKCFSASYGSSDSNCETSIVQNAASFSSSEILDPGQGLTVVAVFPKGHVEILSPQERISFFDTLFGKIITTAIIVAAILWYAILPFALILLWHKRGRDPFVGKSVRAWYDAPETKEKRDLTPAETGALIDETVNNKDVFATIVSLAQKGYIIIHETKKGEFTLEKIKEGKNLLPFETTLFEGIFETAKNVKLKEKKLYETVEKVKKELYDSLVTSGFFARNPQTIRTIFYALAFVAFLTGNLFLVFVSIVFGRIMPRKTLFGAQQTNVAKGLKSFLSTQTRQLKFQADKQMFFEKLLPFAVAFGVEKIWAKRFEEFDLKPPTWYESSSTSFNAAIFATSLNSSYNSFAVSAHPPSSTGSGFSGGGFSGGGGGGGGGGSW